MGPGPASTLSGPLAMTVPRDAHDASGSPGVAHPGELWNPGDLVFLPMLTRVGGGRKFRTTPGAPPQNTKQLQGYIRLRVRL